MKNYKLKFERMVFFILIYNQINVVDIKNTQAYSVVGISAQCSNIQIDPYSVYAIFKASN